MIRRRTALALVAGAAVAVAPAAAVAKTSVEPTKPTPRLGAWSATVTDKFISAPKTHPLTFTVVKRKGRYEIRNLRVTLVEVCAVAGTQPTEETRIDKALRVKRIKVRSNGRFSIDDETATIVKGRLTSTRRMTGTIEGEADGITCSAPTAGFTATAKKKG